MIGEGFYSEELAGHLRKVDPNESGRLDCLAFVRWYMDKEVSMDSAEEAEHLVGWVCKVILTDLQLAGSFTEQVTGTGKAIFEGWFKFAASEARKKFDSTASAERGAIGERLGSKRPSDR